MGLKANFSHEVGPAGRFLLGQSLRSQVMRDMFASDLYNHCIYYIQFSLILLTSPFQRELVFDVFKRSGKGGPFLHHTELGNVSRSSNNQINSY